ncbi:Cell wall assembly regulator [Pleurotus pulmonarius]|nr:Cell wall assembly regulator [Pleurotus pulmonarius]KAF4608993.1 Cell wall assembly regulator [Pleurotus pulmonarius]
MGWFTSLFFPAAATNSRKGQAMSSTHEAFSLPTSSPVFSSHPHAFSAETLGTPDPEGSLSPSYTYPPPNSSTYGYFPTSSGSSRPPSLLPTHYDSLHTPASPSIPYPSLEKTWNRLRLWLNREYPELGDTLNYGILPQDLAQIEMQFGFALPAVVRESYLLVDGQEAESSAGCAEGLFYGLTLLPLEDVYEEWRFWREVDSDPTTGANAQLREVMQSLPPGWVRKEYSQRGWIPLISDKTGNYVGIDLNPAENGSVGQVIVFGRDFDTKVVLWNGDGPVGWAKWLASFVDDLEAGEGFEIGTSNEASSDSEDSLGYESYFYDGHGRGQGDGGGDAGHSGLRLTGEYKGWNVLEALADRSVRKWYDVRVITDAAILPDGDLKNKPTENVGLGVLETTPTSAQTPVPVLADVVDPDETLPDLPDSPTTSKPKTVLKPPALTVTKAPAPRPLELPTPREIAALPSPPESIRSSSSAEDLESGRNISLRDSQDVETGLVSHKRDSPKQDLPSTLPASHADSPPPNLSKRMSPPPEVPDLLTESNPILETTLIQPSPIEAPPPLPTQELATPLQPETPPADLVDTKLPDSDAGASSTIRLIGGGGKAGVVTEEPSTIEPPVSSSPDLTDVASVSSMDSAAVPTQPSAEGGATKKHKKTKSGLSGLKKLVGRRKDSTSSTKDVVPSS